MRCPPFRAGVRAKGKARAGYEWRRGPRPGGRGSFLFVARRQAAVFEVVGEGVVFDRPVVQVHRPALDRGRSELLEDVFREVDTGAFLVLVVRDSVFVQCSALQLRVGRVAILLALARRFRVQLCKRIVHVDEEILDRGDLSDVLADLVARGLDDEIVLARATALGRFERLQNRVLRRPADAKIEAKVEYFSISE